MVGGKGQVFEYDLQGRLAAVTTTPATGIQSQVVYEYGSSGIRISAAEYEDTNSDGVFESSELVQTTEYLIDQRNHTGYAQTIVETTKDSAGQIVKRVAYTFGTDEITQTTTEYVGGVAQGSEVHSFER
ncbi:MAG: hypothetical protein AB8B50_21250 [Pirellulaceae bacterium]